MCLHIEEPGHLLLVKEVLQMGAQRKDLHLIAILRLIEELDRTLQQGLRRDTNLQPPSQLKHNHQLLVPTAVLQSLCLVGSIHQAVEYASLLLRVSMGQSLHHLKQLTESAENRQLVDQ